MRLKCSAPRQGSKGGLRVDKEKAEMEAGAALDVGRRQISFQDFMIHDS